jgi:hypothetical protein
MSGQKTEGISDLQLIRLFPDNEAARKWFEEIRWGKDGENRHTHQ